MERGRQQSIAKGHCRAGYSRFCNDDKSPGFIEHRVSKLDTLAGVAIKYGVEVGDIKRMNGLATDLQMYALNSIKIPLPGRHPPSACFNASHTLGDSDLSASRASHLLDSFQSSSTPQKVSTAMSSLQGYYGLKPTPDNGTAGTYQHNDSPFVKHSPVSSPPLGLRRKSRSVANGFLNENGGIAGSPIVREGRQASDDEKSLMQQQSASEMLLKEDNASGGVFSAVIGKGLALRSKAAGQTSLATSTEETGLTHAAPSPLDSFAANRFSGVRKCSSASSLQDQDSNSLSSIWLTTNWGLKPDATRPIFDGLPNPATTWKRKAALD